MRVRLLPLMFFAALWAACGQRVGPEANATYFWHVTSSTVDFGACSDSTDFRKDIVPLPVQDNSYITYQVDSKGKQATTLTCTRLDPASCAPSDPGIVFDIAGNELTFVRESKAPSGTSGCDLQQDETWTLRDQVRTFALEIATVLSLVDAPAACDQIEADLKARSPNMLGVAGCVVTFTLGGELK